MSYSTRANAVITCLAFLCASVQCSRLKLCCDDSDRLLTQMSAPDAGDEYGSDSIIVQVAQVDCARKIAKS